MNKYRNSLFIIFFVVVVIAGNGFGITRVAKRLNLLEIYGGAGLPTGQYSDIPAIDLLFIINNRVVDVDASDIYNTAYYFGINYGQLKNGHYLVSLGFQFTDFALQDTILLPLDTVLIFPDKPHLRQYDISLNLNYLINDLSQIPWSPYVGLGFQAGIASLTSRQFETENDANIALNLNFGAEISLFKGDKGRQRVSLASINSYNLVATNDRPRELNIGGGIRFWFSN